MMARHSSRGYNIFGIGVQRCEGGWEVQQFELQVVVRRGVSYHWHLQSVLCNTVSSCCPS
ncbi:hypothetical protein M404DRAFT_448085 [Pisolithus tinctorius Marx 270]|uniref:Uncharacterized protein n=1 Tax=Pisolithus tinctorius Marx 270 TaxID=870435 RepID=A0A0C3PXV3_PISTI|nr:hypothetical protein M404DRAFT_448085 [Pisolithus tinctorius Marx 270]